MRLNAFALRNLKEMLRDKLTIIFGIGFPVVLLLLLSLIQRSIPAEAGAGPDFTPERLAPGMVVFGFSFVSLFSAMVISKDRSSSFMLRLFTSPMTSSDFILGYTLPLVPMAVVQALVCYIVALFLGLDFSVNILMALLVSIPAALMFIPIGLLCGSLLNDKQVGGICGALLTNLSAWLSGTWFSVEAVGGAFETIAKLLPFCHAVDAGRAALSGNWDAIFPDLWWVIGYAVVLFVVAILVFRHKMTSDAKA